MGSGKQPNEKHEAKPPQRVGSADQGHEPKPEWADGLRKLYDSVVDEPLPDSFKDLLAKLDETDEDPAS